MNTTTGVHIYQDAVIETQPMGSGSEEFDVVRLSTPDGRNVMQFFVQARDAQNVLRLADALRASALKYGALEEQAVTA